MLNKKEMMKRTIELAKQAMETGNTPFGAIIVKNSEIIAEAENGVSSSLDVTAHAEMLAIRKATEKLKSIDLSGCVLFASGEPCPMCLTAIYYSKINKVFVAYRSEEAAKFGIGNPYVYEQIALKESDRDLQYKDLLPKDVKHPYELWQERNK